MSMQKAKDFLERAGLSDRIVEFDVSSATVELAAKALGCEPGRIAKSLTFGIGERTVMVVAAGDNRVNNQKFRAFFDSRPNMLSADEVERRIGHAVGGVCPFGINDGVEVYLDISLRRFDTVYPACGSSNSCVELKLHELERCSGCIDWIDVCSQSTNSKSDPA